MRCSLNSSLNSSLEGADDKALTAFSGDRAIIVYILGSSDISYSFSAVCTCSAVIKMSSLKYMKPHLFCGTQPTHPVLSFTTLCFLLKMLNGIRCFGLFGYFSHANCKGHSKIKCYIKPPLFWTINH